MEEVCRMALEEYGYDAQERMAVEEMAELTDALMKRRRGRATDTDVVTEIADVIVMATQLSLAYGRNLVAEEIGRKVERLRRRMQNGDNTDTPTA